MGFLNVFKRKPGGTLLGNVLRGFVKKIPVVGAFMGDGAMLISQQDADKRDSKGSDFVPAVLNDAGKSAVGATIAGAAENYRLNPATSKITGAQNLLGPAPYIDGALNASTKKYSLVAGAVVGGLVILALIVKMFKK